MRSEFHCRAPNFVRRALRYARKILAMESAEDHLRRVRSICSGLPGTTEKLSHGEPAFFVKKGLYCMFAGNHHGDGHIAVWIPKAPGEQELLIATRSRTFFRPPSVGCAGWVGIDLGEIDDGDLGAHLAEAWKLINNKKPKASRRR